MRPQEHKFQKARLKLPFPFSRRLRMSRPVTLIPDRDGVAGQRMLSASRGRASSLRTWTSVLGPRRARPIPRLGFLPSHGCPVTDYDERKRRKTITHIEQAERLVAE